MKQTAIITFLSLTAGILLAATAPEQINYQAKVEANGVPFDGAGYFKFAIVDQAGTNTYWSNDGTGVGGSEPTAAVPLNVSGGLLNVMLGDASLPNMTNITAGVFLNPDTWLRVWFGGAAGTSFEKLGPDSKLASVPYAQVAETVPDASIQGEKLAKEAVWPVHEGRNNTIVSYFAEVKGSNLVNVVTLASNKNYIITDLVVCNMSGNSGSSTETDAQISYSVNGTNTILLRIDPSLKEAMSTGGAFRVLPVQLSFKAGLPVPAGAQLFLGGAKNNYLEGPKSYTISGFEISVE